MKDTMTKRGQAALCAVITVLGAGPRATIQASDPPAQLAAFIDDFVADGRGRVATGDLSATYYADQMKATKGALARLHGIDRTKLSPDETIDWRFAESVLVGRELVQEHVQPWKKDLRVYMSFGGISTAILQSIPAQLSNGQKSLTAYVWDVGIHTGKRTYDEAVSILTDKVGFLRWAAELEVDGSAEAPGYRIGHFMGMSEILKMRDEFKQRMGTHFSLSDFHEWLLKVGSMPPALMREGLMASVSASQ